MRSDHAISTAFFLSIMNPFLRCLSVLLFAFPQAQAGITDPAGSGPENSVTAEWPAALGAGGDTRQLVSFSMPSQIKEGRSGKGIIRFDFPASRDIKFKIKVGFGKGIRLSSSVELAAGETQCAFEYSAKNDKLVNLTRKVKLQLFSDGLMIAENWVTIVDDEKPPVLKIQIPAKLTEGKKSEGKVTLSRAVDVDCAVVVSSSPTGQVGAWPTVIPAGKKSANFQIEAVSDSWIEDTMAVAVTARIAGVPSASKVTKVIDDNSRKIHLTLPAGLSDGQSGTGEIDLWGTVTKDVTVELKNNGADYLSMPSSVTIRKGWSSAQFEIRANDRSPYEVSQVVNVTATARGFSAGSGKTVVSESLLAGKTSTLALAANDLVWDPVRGCIYASMGDAAAEPYRHHVVAIDPVTSQITASVNVGQEPGQLGITSGGEALYIVMGDKRAIRKIELSDFSVAYDFSLEGEAASEIVHAEDICTVEGLPDLLVVSHTLTGASHYRCGVAVYDHGVRRRLVAKGDVPSFDRIRIEPSADPSVFAAYFVWNHGGGGWLHRLQLGNDGMTLLSAGKSLNINGDDDIRSDGDVVFDFGGGVSDGKKLAELGILPFEGPVVPDPGKGRFLVFGRVDIDAPEALRIHVFDSSSYDWLRQVVLNGIYVSPESVIRWGDAGLAFRDNGRVILIENRYLMPFVPPPSWNDDGLEPAIPLPED